MSVSVIGFPVFFSSAAVSIAVIVETPATVIIAFSVTAVVKTDGTATFIIATVIATIMPAFARLAIVMTVIITTVNITALIVTAFIGSAVIIAISVTVSVSISVTVSATAVIAAVFAGCTLFLFVSLKIRLNNLGTRILFLCPAPLVITSFHNNCLQIEDNARIAGLILLG